MKHRTGRERRYRKEMKAMGKWPEQPEKPLFKSEKVLADAPLAVQNLLVSAMSKANYHQISSMGREKMAYTKLSDSKTKTKSVLMHPPAKKTKTTRRRNNAN